MFSDQSLVVQKRNLPVIALISGYREADMAGKRLKGEKVPPTEQERQQGRDFAEWLRGAITLSQLTTNAFSQKLSVSSQYLYMLLNDGEASDGSIRRPTEEVIREIAAESGADVRKGLAAAGHINASEASPTTIPGPLSGLPIETQTLLMRLAETLRADDVLEIPILGIVSAGNPIFSESVALGSVRIPRTIAPTARPDELFAIRVEGTCLLGLHIAPGDLLICRKAETARDGNIVVCQMDGGEAVVKRYRETPENGRRWLETVPLNAEPEKVFLNASARIKAVRVGLYRQND